ncbi:protein of unknown function (plasmid) [Pararobbsia alpina]
MLGAPEVTLEAADSPQRVRDLRRDAVDAVLKLLGNGTVTGSLNMVRWHDHLLSGGFSAWYRCD